MRAVKLAYKEDPADLQRVMLPEDHMLVMPLPHEMEGSGKYPEHTKLKSIVEHHVAGTRFGIGVDPADGLMTQGEEG